jgi:cyclase
MSTNNHHLPTSEHFTLERLAEGVYAAIATEGGLAFSNAGIVDLGKRTLVFDTFDSIRAAEDLKAAAEQLTGRPASYVVISHWHPDHWTGNQLFVPRASVIATPEIREWMIPVGRDILEFQEDHSGAEEELRQCQERLEGESDPGQRRAL